MAEENISVNETNTSKTIKAVKKSCYFCNEKKSPTYTDSVTLKRFMSDRGKIVSKQRTGICAKHQRRLAQEIKRARHLSLVPFTIGA